MSVPCPDLRSPDRRAALYRLAVLGALVAGPSAAHAEAAPGQPAPAFTLRDTAGRTVSLADFQGRTVVLEWTNPGCPFVRKHKHVLPCLHMSMCGESARCAHAQSLRLLDALTRMCGSHQSVGARAKVRVQPPRPPEVT